MITIAYSMFGMQFRFGSREDCLVPNDEDSILDVEVAALPQKTMEWFRMSDEPCRWFDSLPGFALEVRVRGLPIPADHLTAVGA